MHASANVPPGKTYQEQGKPREIGVFSLIQKQHFSDTKTALWRGMECANFKMCDATADPAADNENLPVSIPRNRSGHAWRHLVFFLL